MVSNMNTENEISLEDLRKAAEQGDVTAKSHLATMYLAFLYYKGRGVPQDYTEAVEWLRKAAEQGEVEAGRVLEALYDRENVFNHLIRGFNRTIG